MKPDLLPLLSCPQGRFKACGGTLAIREFTSLAGEIIDGSLTCKKCRQVYPVIQGIPLLVHDVAGYIKSNYAHIIRAIGSPDKIHPRVLEYLGTVEQNEPARTVYADAAAAAGYSVYHYGDVGEFKFPGFMADLIARYRQYNSMHIIEEWIGKSGSVNGVGLDLGCNVGGLTRLLAGTCRSTIGVDLSFTALLKAAKITKHLPEKQNSFNVLVGDQEHKVPINLEPVENIEYMVAAAENMPVRHSVDMILAKNLIDIVPSNGRVLREIERLLFAGGQLFLSFVPYLSSLTIEKGQQLPLTCETIKNYMSTISFYEEHTSVPFLLVQTANHLEVFDSTCLIGRKGKEGRKSIS